MAMQMWEYTVHADYAQIHEYVDTYKVDRCLARYSPRLNRPTQLANQNIRISAICRPKLALLGPKNADFGPKIQFFWYHYG